MRPVLLAAVRREVLFADRLDADFKERAFMATYQDLGYYVDGVLLASTAKTTFREAQAYYQVANLSY